MNKNLAVLIALMVSVAGCGGGSSSTGAGTVGSTATSPNLSLTGVAATGAAIIGGTVTARCISGAPLTGTTGADGSFSLTSAGGQTAPCILKVVGSTPAITLYGFAASSGRANLTPVTDMVLAKALASSPAAAFDSFDSTKAATIVNGLDSAKTIVNSYLAGANLGVPTADPVSGNFSVGDANDRIFDALAIALSASKKSFDDLRSATAAGTSIAAFISGGTYSELSPVMRPTEAGFVTGTNDSATAAYAWLGVPYAKPPVGTLRWMPPVSPDSWDTKITQQFGSACPQTGSFFDAPFAGKSFSLGLRDTFGTSVGSEDCLTLNIWRPNTTQSNLPVLFYIHGGSNRSGWSGQYPGAKLAAEQNVVVVTVNYRMNVFGWLNHPALKTGDAQGDSGNFGTLDLIQSLKFVKSNIVAFGGDPENITLSGQSSGGRDAMSLVVSPLAEGLFHKAMIISSGLGGNSPAASQAFASVLLENLVVRDGLATNLAEADAFLATKDNAWIKTYLYGKSAVDLSSMLGKAAAPGMPIPASTPPSILYDGVVQPSGTSSTDALAAIANGKFNNVPLLIGVTNEEGKLFSGAAWNKFNYDMFTTMFNFDPDNPSATPVALTDLIKPAFLPVTAGPSGTCGQTGYTTGYNYFANVCGATGPNGVATTTASYWSGEAVLLNTLQPKQSAIYAYQFSWAQQPEPWNTYFGAAHTGDLPFIFGDFSPGWISFGFSTANKPGREALGLKMRTAIGSFMRTGNPNNTSLGTTWLPWSSSPGGPKRLVFDADMSSTKILMSTAEAAMQ